MEDIRMALHGPWLPETVIMGDARSAADVWRNNLNSIVGDVKPFVDTSRPMDIHSTEKKALPLVRAPVLPPCRVCGAKASGFHYGVNTCEACKGFFRRSLSRQEPYHCVAAEHCEIKSGKRTSCAFCRLKRCIDVGMSKTAIKTGRYTHQLRSRNILEVKMLEQFGRQGNQTESSAPCQQGNPLEVVMAIKKDPHSGSLSCTDSSVDLQMQDLADLFLAAHKQYKHEPQDYWDDDVMLKRQMACYDRYLRTQTLGQDNDSDSANSCESMDAAIDTEHHGNGHWLPGNKSPQPGVLGDNTNTNTVNSTDDGTGNAEYEKILSEVTHDMESGVLGLVSFAKAIPDFSKLPKEDQASLLKVSCFDVWFVEHYRCINVDLCVFAGDVAYHGDEVAPIWGHEVIAILQSLGRLAQKLKFSHLEVAVLIAVIITFPDRADVTNRDLLESIHHQMVQCFRYITMKNYPNLEARFSKVIDFLVQLRELSDRFGNASKTMAPEKVALSSSALLLALFFT